MFTGIIPGLGTVVHVEDRDKFREITVDGQGLLRDVQIGASIAVNGTCLTVTKIEGQLVSFEAMEETLKKTTTGDLKVGDRVNLEQPLRAGQEFGGHFVLGHVDGVGEIVEKAQEGENTRMRFRVPDSLAKYVVDKGSIALDGISLTVCDPAIATFDVWLLPLTLARTTLDRKGVGDHVNVEADYLLKAITYRSPQA